MDSLGHHETESELNRSQFNEIVIRKSDILSSRSEEMSMSPSPSHLDRRFNVDDENIFRNNDSNERNSIVQRRISTNYHHQNHLHRKATGMTRRCVCNLSQCASMNYMCKSERQVLDDGIEVEPGCFIEELESPPITSDGIQAQDVGVTESNGRVTSARRGCIEMLSREKQRLCRDKSGDPIQCCFNEDMCNYPKTFYPPVSPSHNGPINRLTFEPTGVGRGNLNGNLDHQVWLRAAVIAVPVCGLMILIVLIYVARHLLNGEDEYKETSSAQSMISGSARKSSNRFYRAHQTPKPCELLLPVTPGLDYSFTSTTSPPQHQPCYWCAVPRMSIRPNSQLLPQSITEQGIESSPDPFYCPSPTHWNMYVDNESQVGSIGSNNGHHGGPPVHINPNLVHSRLCHEHEHCRRKFNFRNWRFGLNKKNGTENSSNTSDTRPGRDV